jgi:hypothetical protein
MRLLVLSALCLGLTACSSSNDGNRVFHAAGFDIQEGQYMEDFFDDFEEPMHVGTVGYHLNEWTYYVDQKNGKSKIVRYAELDRYGPHSLCTLKVRFSNKYVSDAYSTCNR